MLLLFVILMIGIKGLGILKNRFVSYLATADRDLNKPRKLHRAEFANLVAIHKQAEVLGSHQVA